MKRLFLSAAGCFALTCVLVPFVARAAPNLELNSGTLVWQPGISAILSNQLVQASLTRAPVPAFLNFTNALSVQNHQLLKAEGVQLEEYYGNTFYSALLPSQTFLANTSVLALVFAAEPVLPTNKVLVPSAPAQLPNWAYDPVSNTVKILVAFWKPISSSTVTQALAGLPAVRFGVGNLWAVVAPLPNITNLASLPEVKTIEVGPIPPLPLNDRGRAVANTDVAQAFTYNTSATISGVPPKNPKYNGVSGDAVHIAICDNGIQENHPDFQPLSSSAPARFFYSHTYTYIPPDEPAKHATHVASVAAGNGKMSEVNHAPFALRGHAPEALIGNFPFFVHRFALLHMDAVAAGADVCNHSYVQSYTWYDPIAAELDSVVRGVDPITLKPIPARPSVWGAGNNGFKVEGPGYEESLGQGEEGYFSVFTSAKNSISVGSVDTESGTITPKDDPKTKRRSFTSSMGPTFDGRIKPDVVAPGNWHSLATSYGIVAADWNSSDYIPLSGTSMAAPVVSGIIALMMHQYNQYRNTHCSTCPDLRPAMFKAILIHTAHDLEKLTADPKEVAVAANPDTSTSSSAEPTVYPKGPDFATGYGLVDAELARQKIANTTHWTDQGLIAAKDDSQTWCIEVPPGAPELKVVIAWDDEPGATRLGSDQLILKLVNDLDLQLTDPSGQNVHPVTGQPYLPWVPNVLTPSVPVGFGNPDPISTADTLVAATRTQDRKNNVEMVSVDGPISGPWRATVKGFNLPMGSTQPYSLVSSHTVSACPSEPALAKKSHICQIVPKICKAKLHRVCPLDILRGRIRFPLDCPIAIDEICKYVVNCPGCPLPQPWELCPGFQLKIRGVPRHAELVLLDDDWTILQHDQSSGNTRTLNVPPRSPGDRQFLVITLGSHQPLLENLDLRLHAKPSRKVKGSQ